MDASLTTVRERRCCMTCACPLVLTATYRTLAFICHCVSQKLVCTSTCVYGGRSPGGGGNRYVPGGCFIAQFRALRFLLSWPVVPCAVGRLLAFVPFSFAGAHRVVDACRRCHCRRCCAPLQEALRTLEHFGTIGNGCHDRYAHATCDSPFLDFDLRGVSSMDRGLFEPHGRERGTFLSVPRTRNLAVHFCWLWELQILAVGALWGPPCAL